MKPASKIRAPATTLLAALLLAACGGSGGDTLAPAAAPPGDAAAAAGHATCNLPGFQAEALQFINARRAAGAVCGTRGSFAAALPLAANTALDQAALRHTDDMVAHNFFDHTGSDGSNAGQRASAAGYAWRTWGENIAAGQPSVASVMAGWMASDGHCANIMNASFRDLGLACVSGSAANQYRSYWTLVLAAR